jgi:hypothetical protein
LAKADEIERRSKAAREAALKNESLSADRRQNIAAFSLGRSEAILRGPKMLTQLGGCLRRRFVRNTRHFAGRGESRHVREIAVVLRQHLELRG